MAFTFGSEYVFETAGTTHHSVQKIDSSRYFITYRDGGNSNYSTAVVAEVAFDGTISFGTPVVFYNGPVTAGLCLLDTDKVLLVYGFSTLFFGRVATISGTFISFESQQGFFSSGVGDYLSLTQIDIDKAFLFGFTKSRTPNGLVVNVSGTTISVGTDYSITSTEKGTNITQSANVVGSDGPIYGYQGMAAYSNNVGQSKVVSWSVNPLTDVVSFSSAVQIPNATTGVSISFLGSTFQTTYIKSSGNPESLVWFWYGGTTNPLAGVFPTLVSTDSLTFAEDLYSFSVGTDEFAVIWTAGSSLGFRKAATSSDTITFETALVPNLAFSPFPTGCSLDDDTVVLVYSDGDNSYYGTTILGSEKEAVLYQIALESDSSSDSDITITTNWSVAMESDVSSDSTITSVSTFYNTLDSDLSTTSDMSSTLIVNSGLDAQLSAVGSIGTQLSYNIGLQITVAIDGIFDITTPSEWFGKTISKNARITTNLSSDSRPTTSTSSDSKINQSTSHWSSAKE